MRSTTLLKRRLQHRRFPVNCAKFLRAAFLQNTSNGCFLLALNRKLLGNFAFSSNKDCCKRTSLFTFTQKEKFLVEQRAKSNEQRAKSSASLKFNRSSLSSVSVCTCVNFINWCLVTGCYAVILKKRQQIRSTYYIHSKLTSFKD